MMSDTDNKREIWLAAAWPGMGNVGVAAAAYLVSKLDATFVTELSGDDVFDLDHIEVQAGLAKPGRMPRSMFFEVKLPNSPRDLLVFLGEAQPPVGGYKFCKRLLDEATNRGVSRIVTFAAMATQLHPKDAPKVFGAATNGEGIRQLQALEVSMLKNGQITGLNGVLIAAAAERGIPGMCLLGELPYFAAGVPNPKASMAVLEVFATLFGLEIDMSEISEQAEQVEQGLIELLEKLQESAREQAGEEGFPLSGLPQSDEDTDAGDEDDAGDGPAIDEATRRRIEMLFHAASEDRSKAVHLKEELDRLGVFKQYEDRFLDLFKQGE